MTGIVRTGTSKASLMRLLFVVAAISMTGRLTSAFVSPTTVPLTGRTAYTPGVFPEYHRIETHLPPLTRPATSTSLSMISWEDVVYHAQSLATNLASVSLEDPANLVTSLPIMYGAGLLTSFSPCVWGLLPLTMSYISNAAGERQDQQTTLPTLAFAAGLAVVFCSLGMAAVELGGVFGGSTSSSVLLPLFSNVICLAMGLKLLELVEFPLPSFNALSSAPRSFGNSDQSSGQAAPELLLVGEDGLLTMDSSRSRSRDEKGSLVRTFLLGGSSALVASPCATPVLTSILAFVAKAQNPALGAALLLGYTLGYSTPLLIIASTGGKALNNLKQQERAEGGASVYGKIAPWVTPLTGGILLWYGTNGLLTAILGDPSMAGLPVLE
ncbi:biogenesis protein [Phaeodactylum tricornutum CCAP 1055/1]|uniref:Biogenesis protein n=2 Tax=Phaeodactylum tricornutum TaxID=2850 RepID=B7G4R4_PHATC|nr:biogenesis protein [Phaeodactylum tricornutum CCAP 1055/1]EEC46499.1 biogenesis protein [Phaeodactylum tricornutum CCAP 1055/1]|eukprot:XP_002181959.1 biogenesis protein [Phaeodactylum tricornutum CCAP 1055/1]